MASGEITDLSGGLIAEADMAAIAKIDDTIRTSQKALRQAEDSNSPMLKAMLVARAMKEVRDLLTPEIMKDVMALMGSKNGFKTDRDTEQSKYTVGQVKEVMTEAFLRGFFPVNNEVNIIAGGFYAAKNGLERHVREWPGLTGLEMRPDVPVKSGSGEVALVGYTAKWLLDGKPYSIECLKTAERDQRIPVRVNSKSIVDAIIGKATRKMYARIHQQLTGSAISHGDPDDAPEDLTTVEGSVVTASDVEAAEAVEETTDPLEGLGAAFGDVESVLECERLREEWFSANENLSDEQRDAVFAACREQINKIRSSRGDKSN